MENEILIGIVVAILQILLLVFSLRKIWQVEEKEPTEAIVPSN